MRRQRIPSHRSSIADFYYFVETSDALFRMLTEDKIGQFQYLGVLRNNYKTEFRVTPVQKN